MLSLRIRPLVTPVLTAALLVVVFSATPVVARAQSPTITAISAPRQVVTIGDDLTLSVTATDATSYQWKRNGLPIAGATDANYTITSAQPWRDNGWYQVVASNASGSTISAAIFVNVVGQTAMFGFGDNSYGQITVPPGLGNVIAIDAGAFHALALRSDGTVAAWGNNDSHQVAVPAGLNDVVAVAAGHYFSLALKADGTVVGWGTGAGEGAGSAVPSGMSNVVAIAAGGGHSVALKSDGTVVAWGRNVEQQTAIPPEVSNVIAIAAGGYHSLALKADGSVIGWGRNSEGQINAPSATKLRGVDAGHLFSLGLNENDAPVGWGYNGFGQLSPPQGLPMLTAITGGLYHTIALGSDGSLHGWGRNSENQRSFGGLGGVRAIAAGFYFSLALHDASADAAPVIAEEPQSTAANLGERITLRVGGNFETGTVPVTYQWRNAGTNIPGATNASYVIDGIAASDAASYDVVVTNYLGSVTSNAAVLSVNSSPVVNATHRGRYVVPAGQSLALTLDPAISASATVQWTHNGFAIPGATGRAFTIANATPTSAGYYRARYTVNGTTTNSAPIFVLVQPSRTELVAWGNNGAAHTAAAADVQDAVALAAASWWGAALRADGTIVAWAGYSPPADLRNVVAVSIGSEHGLALKADGTVIPWGSNFGGATNVPAGLTDIIAVAAGYDHSLAVKADGTVVAWGTPSEGATAVPPGLNNVVAVAAGDRSSLALKSDGTVVGWGRNSSGQTTPPAGMTHVRAIALSGSRALALGDGVIQAWGSGANETPPGVAEVVSIALGSGHSLVAKRDGTVLAWGSNGSNQLLIPPGLNSVFAVSGGIYSSTSYALRDASGDMLPAISTQPASVTAFAGQDITLSVAATGGTSLLRYQWRKSGVPIAGATGATLFLPRVSAGDAANYDVVVSNQLGSMTSAAATLTFNPTPAVALSVSGRQIVAPGESLTLTATAAIPGPVTYQWRRNGRAISGATDASHVISNATWRDAGVYQVVASNATGPVVSGGVFVGVTTPMQLRAWGDNSYGQIAIPAGLSDVLSVAAGNGHSLALKTDGSVVAWGNNQNGQCNVPTGLSDVIAVAAGSGCSMALKADGTVITWGSINYTPIGLADVIAIASARGSSARNIALKSDGTVLAWDTSGVRTDVPGGLDDVVEIAVGSNHWLALKANGTVVGWGSAAGAAVPTELADVIAITASPDSWYSFSLALKADGTVVAWGNDNYGQTNVPTGLANVVTIGSSNYASFAQKADGTIAQWGNFSAPPSLFDAVFSLAVGANHALVLRDPSADSVPSINVQPASQLGLPGQTATLSVAATGGALSYNWRRNGSSLGVNAPTLTLTNFQSWQAGTYDVVVTNYLGSVTSAAAVLTAAVPPAFTSAGSTTFSSGVSGSFTVTASGTPAPTFSIASGTFPSWALFDSSTGTISGTPPDTTGSPFTFTVQASNSAGAASQSFTLTVAPAPQLVNLSARMNVPVEGVSSTFTISGSGTKTVLIRGVGPSLAAFGVSGTMADPQLVVVNSSSGTAVASNDDWGGDPAIANAASSVGAFPLSSTTSKDSAIVTTLSAGTYTATLSGVASTTGAALLELYDAGGSGGAKLSYLSIRGPISAGEMMTAGVVVSGLSSQSLLVRAMGPSLATTGALPDPLLTLYSGSTVIAQNDDWGGSASLANAAAQVGAFPFASPSSKDSGLFVTVSPGNYTAQVSGKSGMSGTVLLEVFDASVTATDQAPYFATSPGSQTTYPGATATFSAVAAGTPPITYQWRKEGTAISGATSSTFTLDNVQTSDAGSYDVIATNSAGSATSAAAILMVAPPTPPTITSQPTNRSVLVGLSTIFSVGVTGSAPLSYQWRKDGVNLTGATDASLTIASTQLSDAGVYDVRVSNLAGSATSLGATLTVAPPTPPSIITQPASRLVSVGASLQFFVTADGTSPFAYQWRKNGVPIAGATSSQFVLVATSLADSAAYDVVVSNVAGSITSAPATLSFGQLPLAANPANNYVRLGNPASFAIAPVVASAPAYQWKKDDAMIPGATGASFTIASVSAGDLGNYSVSASDGVSAPTTRGPARLALRGTGSIGRRFLAVGTGGTVLTSTDGIEWVARATGTAADLRAVAASGDMAVAVGAGGTILTSTDTVTWSALPVSSTTGLNGVVAGPDRFVAVGDAGRVIVSADGVGWYLAWNPTNVTLNSIAYGAGVYVMVGNLGALFTSPDGFDWTNRNSETTNAIRYVTFAENQFVALTVAGELLMSTDAISWMPTPTTPPVWLRGLAHDGEKFVAVGDAGRVFTSADGNAWDSRSSGTAQSLLGITWSGYEIPPDFTPALLSYLNVRSVAQPVSFSAQPGQTASFSAPFSGGGLSYSWSKNGATIAGATQHVLTLSNVQATDVGEYAVTTTSPAGTVTSPAGRLGLIGSGPLANRFFAVGAEGTVLGSADGVSFTERSTSPGRTLRAIATSAFRAVAVGRSGTIAVSDDGMNWSYRSLSTMAHLRGIAAGPTQFVAVGSAGLILISYDQGESWQQTVSGTTQPLWSVAWNGSRFLVVGEGGTVLTSMDGVAWTSATPPTGERLYGVAANGSAFVAVTEAGRTFTTTDGGAAWQAGAASGPLWVRGAALASDGTRVAVGDLGLIASSSDGVNWIRRTSLTANRLYGVVWSGLPAVLPAGIDDAVNGPALRITAEPQSLTIASGGTAVFSVGAGGVNPLAYQWQRNGIDLPGAQGATLTLANVQVTNAGNYTVVVSNATGAITSGAAILTVTAPQPGIAPTITTPPESRTAFVGGSTVFSVVADGTLPLSYQWRFNGQPIPGAVTSNLTLSNLQLANGGSYAVTVTNAYGAITSPGATLTVSNATGAPVITMQPVGQSVSAGSDVAFTVGATGTGSLLYQWRRNGEPLAGATSPTLTLVGVTVAQAGTYTVVVSNALGEAASEPAGLTVVPTGMMATHAQVGAGYTPGSTVTIASTLTFVGIAESLGWEVLLPAGWSFAGGIGSEGDVKPAFGDTQLLSWAWTSPPPNPISFRYILNIPASASGSYTVPALAIVRQGGVPIQMLARPDPLVLLPATSVHSADTNGDARISLLELTRVIELYNTRNGTVRTGAYTVQDGTEDGFAQEPARASSDTVTLTRYHSADTQGATAGSPPDGRIGLLELTRVIELYNYRTGTTRTGQYRAHPGTEDGFAPGP